MAATNRRYQKDNYDTRQTVILSFSLDAVTLGDFQARDLPLVCYRTEYQVAERHPGHPALL